MITEHLGNCQKIKILQFLINNKDNSHSIREILVGAKTKHKGLLNALRGLLAEDMIYIDKKTGRGNLYKINKENAAIESLVFLNKPI
jgi:hypothetical protein